jgi:hypothetical protein
MLSFLAITRIEVAATFTASRKKSAGVFRETDAGQGHLK